MPKKDNSGTADPAENVNGRLDNQVNNAGGQQSTDQLGDQVRPENQLDEDNGNRTLARPTPDPGPVIMDENGQPTKSNFVHPDRSNGRKPYSQLNDPIAVTRRVSTTPPYMAADPSEVMGEHLMAPDLAIHGGASDMYHKEGRNNDGRDPVHERIVREREVAPMSNTGVDDFVFAPEPAAKV